MQACKAALAVAFRHSVYLIIYVGFLSFMGVFMAGGLNLGGSAEYEAVKPPFAVIDRDNSELSHALTAFLATQGEQTSVADDAYAMQDAVATGSAHLLVVVDEGYERAFLEAARTGADEPLLKTVFSFDSRSGTLLDQQLDQYLGLVHASAALDPDLTAEKIVELASEAAAQQVDVETMRSDNAPMAGDRFAFYLQWSCYTLTASIVVCVSLMMSAFNRTDINRRNLVAPISSLRLGLQKAAACLILTVFAWAVSVSIGLAAFGASLEGVSVASVATALGAALAYSIMALMIGFLLGQLGANEMVSNAAGNIAGMVMAFLGGAWISLDMLTPAVRALAHFSPAFWYTNAVGEAIRTANPTLATLSPAFENVGVVLLFAAALFVVALVVGRLRMKTAESGGNAAAHADRA